MANLKQEGRRSIRIPKFRRLKKFCLLAASLASIVGSENSVSKADVKRNIPEVASTQPASQPSQRIRCYEYKNKELRVYIEKNTKTETETGKEIPLSYSQLNIKDENNNARPLAYFCNHAGYLFWITTDTIYIRRIIIGNEKLGINNVLETKHIEPDEYAVPGVKVVSADVWRNPEAPWENITIATLTNTGLFQAVRYSMEALVKGKPERRILDLTRKLDAEDRWPERGVVSGAVGVLDGEKFSIIPIGDRRKGNVRMFYHLALEGKGSFGEKLAGVNTMYLSKNHPGLKNVFGITKPIRYERKLGGWVVNLIGERRDGKVVHIFPVLTP